jgi:hypothetical protein
MKKAQTLNTVLSRFLICNIHSYQELVNLFGDMIELNSIATGTICNTFTFYTGSVWIHQLLLKKQFNSIFLSDRASIASVASWESQLSFSPTGIESVSQVNHFKTFTDKTCYFCSNTNKNHIEQTSVTQDLVIKIINTA